MPQWPWRMNLLLVYSSLAWWGLGLALKRGKTFAFLFLWLMLAYPLLYYLVFSLPRYRHPIEPEMFILAVYLVS